MFSLPIGSDGSCGCSENMHVQTAEANLADFRHYVLFLNLICDKKFVAI